MSDYAKVLKRLREESHGESRALHPATQGTTLPVELPSEPPELPAARKTRQKTILLEPLRRPGSVAIANLLDVMRSLEDGRQSPTLVLAPVSRDQDLRGLMHSLVRQAGDRGLDIVVAELITKGGRPSARECLRSRPVGDDRYNTPGLTESTSPYDPVPIAEWHANHATERDIVILEAPSLEESVDAALVARHFDGLLLVAESEKTSRVALKNAADRARESGCDVLGIVLEGSRRWLPRWLDRLLDEFLG